MTIAYSQISDTLFEFLLACGCYYIAFFLILQLFCRFFKKKVSDMNIFNYLCIDLGEKSRVDDALAYYFALTEET